MRQHFLTLTQMKIKEQHTQGLVISSRLETCYLSAPHHYLPSLSHPHTRCCSNSSRGSRYLVINGVNFAPDKKKGSHFTVHYFKASVETKAQCLLHWKWAVKYSSYKGSNRPTAQPRGRKARMYACAQDWNAQSGHEEQRTVGRQTDGVLNGWVMFIMLTHWSREHRLSSSQCCNKSESNWNKMFSTSQVHMIMFTCTAVLWY